LLFCLADPSLGCALDGWIAYNAVCERERGGEREMGLKRQTERERDRRGEKVLTIPAV